MLNTSLPNPALSSNLLATILADESYHPSEPVSLKETGLPVSLIESLLIKRLAAVSYTHLTLPTILLV